MSDHKPITEAELVEMEQELGEGAVVDVFALADKEMPRLIAEVRRLREELAQYQKGYARPAAEPLGIASLTDGGMDD